MPKTLNRQKVSVLRRSRVSGKSSLRNFSTAVQKCMGDVKMTSFDLAIKFHLSTVLQKDHETLVLNAGYENPSTFFVLHPVRCGLPLALYHPRSCSHSKVAFSQRHITSKVTACRHRMIRMYSLAGHQHDRKSFDSRPQQGKLV